MILRMVFLCSFIFFFSALHAQVYRGPISSGVGGAGRAGMQSAESALLNPALISMLKGYEIDSYYRDGEIDNGQHRQAYGFGATDNGEEVFFPGSLHYFRLRDTGRVPSPAVNGELWHAGVAQKFLDQGSIGVSGYRLRSDVKDDRVYEQWNYSLGILWTFNEAIGVAYVADNLANPGSIVPHGLREDLRQSVGFFTAFTDIARLRVDIARAEHFNPGHKMAYMLGMETLSNKFFILRLGYRYDDLANERIWTGGLGFNGPRLKLNYAVEKNQSGTSGALHNIDIQMPF